MHKMTASENNEKNEYPKASNGVVLGAIVTYAGGIALLMAFCSPYWIESYEVSHTTFKNMGLWQYCFDHYEYPYYQFHKYFHGCHNVFSDEYYVIREWLVPGWLMAVQGLATVAFILTFFSLSIFSLIIMRIPLKGVLQYEWILIKICYLCVLVSSVFMFIAVAVFGGCAYRRDWLMYPKFNVLSWSYALAVVSFMILGLASLILRRESINAYEIRGEAKNLVMQMEMQEPGFHPSRNQSHSRSLHGYI